MQEDLLYQLALSNTKWIGGKTARKLYSEFGSARNIFQSSREELLASRLLSPNAIDALLKQDQLEWAENELQFIQQYNIQVLTSGSANYPKRLSHYDDAPFLLYYKGTADLNAHRVVSIVGTRKPTDYGRMHCQRLVEALRAYNVLVVSGLAYGIDATAHRQAVQLGMDTVGVVAHGLDQLYPAKHKKLAEKMLQQGGLLTEFPSNTIPIRSNFPMRNRIIAAMTDAVVVVETGRSGGSIITANMANEYQKDVFALPGRVQDTVSEGCNMLIKSHRASLMESAEDIAYILRWEKQPVAQQKQIFTQLNEEEKKVTNLLLGEESLHLNKIIQLTQISTSRLASLLLQLEMKGVVKSSPGKYFRLA